MVIAFQSIVLRRKHGLSKASLPEQHVLETWFIESQFTRAARFRLHL